MKHRVSTILMLVFFTLSLSLTAQTAIPHLLKQGTATQLIVNNKPFLILGGELGNSSSSSTAYMYKIWPTLEQMNLNTILAPVYWELVEPEEGQFNFTLIDELIEDARTRDMKLVLLWFGSWKNSMSCYVPGWVKSNQERFPRALNAKGEPVEIVSPFSEECLQADLNAFVKLMEYLKKVDSVDNTVIMVQVENEIGMLPDARDYGPKATALYKQQVPESFTNYLVKNKQQLMPEFLTFWQQAGGKQKGTWQELFGDTKQAEEVFQAWHFAQYTNKITKAGKEAYNLPMYINAALNRIGYAPGEYPSAGPLPHLMDVWRAGAPAVDFLAPDIYFPNFEHWTTLYDRGGNPLFIPEARFEPSVAAKMFYAFGEHYAMGFSPFSIESTNKPAEEPITKGYHLMKQLAPTILEYQGKQAMKGVLLTHEKKYDTLELGGYRIIAKHDYTLGWSPEAKMDTWPHAGALIICTNEGEYFVAGSGVLLNFQTLNKTKTKAAIYQIDEGEFIDGVWTPERRMNGDQSHQGRHLRIPMYEYSIQKLQLYSY